MWLYEKKLEYPVNLKNKNPKFAKVLITQFGGPDGELGASMRYLTQRYTMPTGGTKGLLTDIGTEELAHIEIISAMFYQLIRGVSPKELEAAGLGGQYAQHGYSPFLVDANGVPWSASYIQSTSDPVTCLHEDLAAEEKARTTYEHLMNLTDDVDILDILKFLRQREVTHFQRFGEALMNVQGGFGMKKNFHMNPNMMNPNMSKSKMMPGMMPDMMNKKMMDCDDYDDDCDCD